MDTSGCTVTAGRVMNFVDMLDKLGYDIQITYVRKEAKWTAPTLPSQAAGSGIMKKHL